MKFRIDVVMKDEKGKELSRSTVGEYGNELDAYHELEKQEKVLRTLGNNSTCVEMLRFPDKPQK